MIARHLRAIVAALILCWLAFPASASKAAEPIAQVHLYSYRKGVAARVEVGGRLRLFQLDTAGGLTVISPALAKELNCGPWGSVTGFHMTGTKISAPRCDALHLRWGALPLTSPVVAVMEVGTPDTPIDGLLGLCQTNCTGWQTGAGRVGAATCPALASLPARSAVSTPRPR